MLQDDLAQSKTLYMQIKALIIKDITSGKYIPGSQIPSEKELGEQYGVSRITIRNAIAEVIKDGLLFTVQGKGTFVRAVNNQKVSQKLKRMDYFEDTIKSMGMTAGTIILSSQVTADVTEPRQILKLSEQDSAFEINLLGTANGKPLVLYQSFFQEEIGHMMYERACEKQKLGEAFSTLDFYQSMKFLNASYIDQTFEAMAADHTIAGVMKVKVGFPMFLITSVVYSGTDIPLEYKRAFYRSDMYRFRVIRQIEQN